MYFPESDSIQSELPVYKEYCEQLDSYFVRNVEGVFQNTRVSDLLDIPLGIVDLLLEKYEFYGVLELRYALACQGHGCGEELLIDPRPLKLGKSNVEVYCDACQREYTTITINAVTKYVATARLRHEFSEDRRAEWFTSKLVEFEPGKKHAHDYQRTIFQALQWIFESMLCDFVYEQKIDNGLGKIDVCARNSDENGFFKFVLSHHHVKCPNVFFECKNYSDDPENPEFDQILGRLDPLRGMLGFIVCREIEDREKALGRCINAYNRQSKLLLLLDDKDIVKMAELRQRDETNAISSHLHDLLHRIVMGNNKA